MSILLVASEREDFIPIRNQAGRNIITSTDAIYRDTGLSRHTVMGQSVLTTARTKALATPITTGWAHCHVYFSGNSGAGLFFQLLKTGSSPSDRPQVQLERTSGTTTYQFRKWNGTAYVNVGSTFTLTYETRQNIDVAFDLSASGYLRLYSGNALVFDFTGDMTVGDTNIDAFGICGAVGNGTAYSEIILATSDTRGLRVNTIFPNANGAVNNFTGGFNFVNKTAVTFNNMAGTNGTGIDSLYHFSDINVSLADKTVLAVYLTMYATLSEDGNPTNLRALTRHAGTTVESANLISDPDVLDLGVLMTNNPVTGAAWTTADLNVIQFGVRSV